MSVAVLSYCGWNIGIRQPCVLSCKYAEFCPKMCSSSGGVCWVMSCVGVWRSLWCCWCGLSSRPLVVFLLGFCSSTNIKRQRKWRLSWVQWRFPGHLINLRAAHGLQFLGQELHSHTYPLGPSVEAALHTDTCTPLIREMFVSLWKWLNFQSRMEDLNFAWRSKCLAGLAQVKTSGPKGQLGSFKEEQYHSRRWDFSPPHLWIFKRHS